MSDDHESRLWYFAYGSNLNDSIFLERRQMHPLAVRWGWLEEYRLTFNIPMGPGERGVANIEATPGARTYGALYLLTAEEFDRLDHTEGVKIGIYRRLPVEAVTPNDDRVAAFAYQSSLTTAGRKPSPRYMNLLVEGALRHGLPGAYVAFLKSFELAIDERLREDPGDAFRP